MPEEFRNCSGAAAELADEINPIRKSLMEVRAKIDAISISLGALIEEYKRR